MMDLLLCPVSKPSTRLIYISSVCSCVYCWRNSPFLQQHTISTSLPSPSLPPYPAQTHLFLSFLQNIHHGPSVVSTHTCQVFFLHSHPLHVTIKLIYL